MFDLSLSNIYLRMVKHGIQKGHEIRDIFRNPSVIIKPVQCCPQGQPHQCLPCLAAHLDSELSWLWSAKCVPSLPAAWEKSPFFLDCLPVMIAWKVGKCCLTVSIFPANMLPHFWRAPFWIKIKRLLDQEYQVTTCVFKPQCLESVIFILKHWWCWSDYLIYTSSSTEVCGI